jgi:hypothetical protein
VAHSYRHFKDGREGWWPVKLSGSQAKALVVATVIGPNISWWHPDQTTALLIGTIDNVPLGRIYWEACLDSVPPHHLPSTNCRLGSQDQATRAAADVLVRLVGKKLPDLLHVLGHGRLDHRDLLAAAARSARAKHP